MQQSSIISFESVGFRLNEFDILIKFIETKEIDLSFADNSKDVAELLSKLEPFLLCNDFFQYKDITASIVEYLEKYESCMTLAKQKWLFETTKSQTLKDVIGHMESTRLEKLNSLYQAMTNKSDHDCIQQLQCDLNLNLIANVTANNNCDEKRSNDKTDVTRLLENLKQIYQCLLTDRGYHNIEFAATIALWKHCFRNKIISKDEFADIKILYESINDMLIKEDEEYFCRSGMEMMISIMVFDLLGLELGFGLNVASQKTQHSKQLQNKLTYIGTTTTNNNTESRDNNNCNDEKVNSSSSTCQSDEDVNYHDDKNSKRKNVHSLLELCCHDIYLTCDCEYAELDDSLFDRFGNLVPLMRVDEIKKLVCLLNKKQYGEEFKYSEYSNHTSRMVNQILKQRRRISKCKDFINLLVNHCHNKQQQTEILHEMYGLIIPILQDPSGIQWIEKTLIGQYLTCSNSDSCSSNITNNNNNNTNNINTRNSINDTDLLTEYIDGFLHWCITTDKKQYFEHKKIFRLIELFLNHGALFNKCQQSSIRCCFELLIEPKSIPQYDDYYDNYDTLTSDALRRPYTPKQQIERNNAPATVSVDRAFQVMKQIANQLTPKQITELFQSLFCK